MTQEVIAKTAHGIAVTLFHPLVEKNGKLFSKPHHGAFIDDLAGRCAFVNLAVPVVREEPHPRWLYDDKGELTYNYEIKSSKVRIFPVPFSSFAPLERIQRYREAISTADEVFFFSPSLVSLAAGLVLWLRKVPFYAYLSTDPALFYRERFGGRFAGFGSFLGWILGVAQIFVLKKAKGLLVTGAGNLALFSETGQAELVSPLIAMEPREPLARTDSEDIRLLFVGVITPRKRVKETVALAAALKMRFPHTMLSLVGTTDQKFAEYFEEVRAGMQKHSFQLEGFVSDTERLREIYSNNDYLLLISEFEGFPKVVYEAMENGVIPILSRLDSYEGILEEGKHCLFFEGDVDNLFRRITGLSSEDKVKMRERNLRFVRERRKKSAAEQLIEMLQR